MDGLSLHTHMAGDGGCLWKYAVFGQGNRGERGLGERRRESGRGGERERERRVGRVRVRE